MNLSALLAWAASRLREPSTMAALASLLVAAGINLDAGTLHNAAWAAAAVCGALGVFLAERGTTPTAQIAEDVLAALVSQNPPKAPPAAVAILALLLTGAALSACSPDQVKAACAYDAALQPVAAAGATAAGGDAAKAAAVDTTVVHPLVQAGCAAAVKP